MTGSLRGTQRQGWAGVETSLSHARLCGAATSRRDPLPGKTPPQRLMFFLWKSFLVQLQTWGALHEVGVLYAELGYSSGIELHSVESGCSVQN